MKRKILAVIGILVLVTSIFAGPAAADTPSGPPDVFPRNNMAPPGLDPMDLSVERV